MYCSLTGSVYAYSNFGYVLLGLIVEKVSGVKYELYMRMNLWRAGVYRMKLGKTTENQADFTEVRCILTNNIVK